MEGAWMHRDHCNLRRWDRHARPESRLQPCAHHDQARLHWHFHQGRQGDLQRADGCRLCAAVDLHADERERQLTWRKRASVARPEALQHPLTERKTLTLELIQFEVESLQRRALRDLGRDVPCDKTENTR